MYSGHSVSLQRLCWARSKAAFCLRGIARCLPPLLQPQQSAGTRTQSLSVRQTGVALAHAAPSRLPLAASKSRTRPTIRPV